MVSKTVILVVSFIGNFLFDMQKRTLKNSDVKNNTTNNIATISLNHFTILLNISGYCLYMGFNNSLFAFFGTKVQDIILVILKKVFRKYSRAFCLTQNIEVFFPVYQPLSCLSMYKRSILLRSSILHRFRQHCSG